MGISNTYQSFMEGSCIHGDTRRIYKIIYARFASIESNVSLTIWLCLEKNI